MALHFIMDWLGQSEWMAVNKVKVSHPAGYVHAALHGAIQLLVFPWWAALAIGVTHFLIDLRSPVAAWSKLIRQTQPMSKDPRPLTASGEVVKASAMPFYDLGMDVRIWVDQVFHIGVVAIVAVVVST
jgi:hypothetical protein